MINSQKAVALLSDPELLARTRELVDRSHCTEADLLVYLGEIDQRKLFLEAAFPSMFAYCVGEFRFSEDAAYSRILVARAARELPAMIGALRCGQVHLTGLRLLAPHLTGENHRELLVQAAGKTKSEIEELVARLAPRPAVAPTIRKLPERSAPTSAEPLALRLAPAPAPREDCRPVIAPLVEETYKVQFTASRELRDKLKQAQDLLRHRVPDGDLARIVEKGLDLLIDQVKKERFAVGRKPGSSRPLLRKRLRRATCPARSGGRSTSETADAARSSTRAGTGARRRATWNSITSTDSRAHTCTMRIESGCFAGPTISTQRKSYTGGSSWSTHGPCVAQLVPGRAAARQ